MVEEGVEHPYPIKAMPHELLELLLNDLTFFFSRREQPHDQLSCFSGLSSVNVGNGASVGFLM